MSNFLKTGGKLSILCVCNDFAVSSDYLNEFCLYLI
jgi:hypothetical protein